MHPDTSKIPTQEDLFGESATPFNAWELPIARSASLSKFQKLSEYVRISLSEMLSISPEALSHTSSSQAARGVIEWMLIRLAELENLVTQRWSFSESLSDIQKQVMSDTEIPPEMQGYRIIQKSLKLLQEYLQMDYAGIWLKKHQEYVIIHENGTLHENFNQEVIYAQMARAEEETKEGNVVYLCPSRSDGGWVDAVFVFRNLQWEPIGYLLLDDYNTENKIPNAKLGSVVHIFYDRLKNLVYELELNLTKQEFSKVKSQLANMEAELENAQYDKLTGLLLKQYGELHFQRDIERIRRSKSEAFGCIWILDIDFFKKINDTMGHLVGDEVLKKIGELLKYGYTCEKLSYLPRKTDTVCRWGGEEFVFLLWDTNGEGGKIFADKIREIIESVVFQNTDGSEFWITVTIGLTEINTSNARFPNSSMKTYFEKADKALYAGKTAWRNQVVLHTDV